MFSGLADGKLVRWTKGFNCEGVEGRNVVELLQEALARRGDVQIEICAILNDTTGTCHVRYYFHISVITENLMARN